MSSKGKLNSYWIKHERDPKKREDLEKTIRNSTVALSRLQEIIDEAIENANQRERSAEQYDSPSWAYKQADINGELRALHNMRKLTDHLS